MARSHRIFASSIPTGTAPVATTSGDEPRPLPRPIVTVPPRPGRGRRPALGLRGTMAIPAANARTIAARRQALAVLAGSPDGCTRAEMSRRGFGPAVLNDLLLKRLAIAHMATEVRGGIAIQTRLTITPAGLREIVGGEGDE